jgi:putative transposase
MKARFTDEQIIAMIKEQESGEKTADVCRRHGISSATFYKYKSKYGGMEPSDAKRLRALEDENQPIAVTRPSVRMLRSQPALPTFACPT